MKERPCSSNCFFSYPLEKTRRFHCSNSSQCLTSKQLCDGVSDCGEGTNDDEEDLCSWLADFPKYEPSQDHYFICGDGNKISMEKRCNRKRDCSGEEYEDELFCDIEQTSFLICDFDTQGYLVDVTVFPPSNSSSVMESIIPIPKLNVYTCNINEGRTITEKSISISL